MSSHLSFTEWLAQKGITTPGPILYHQLQNEYYQTVEYPAMLANMMAGNEQKINTLQQAVQIRAEERVTEQDILRPAFGFNRGEQLSFKFHYPQQDGYPEEWLSRGFSPDGDDAAWQAKNEEIRKKLVRHPVKKVTGSFPVSGGSFEQGLENARVETVWESELSLDRAAGGEFRGSYFASLREELPNSTVRELDEQFIETVSKKKSLFERIPHWGRGVAVFGGAAIAAGLIAATDPLSIFSAKDDEYNTIEGLRHDGIAAQKRRELTEFGSGWKGQGLPSSLIGIPIDEEILNFRADILNDPTKKQQYQQWERTANATGEPSQFESSDLFEYNVGTINAINEKNKALRAVHLNRFTIEIDDADTLLLKRKGIWHLFDDPIQVRLAGIDAPEVAGHSEDPLEPIRIWQDQPLGHLAADRLRGILEQQEDPQLVISATDQTYGRYLGVVAGDNGENLNLKMLRMGAVADLPFGNPEDDILSRSASHTAQEQAFGEQIGMWSLARYQASHEVTNQLGTSITFNTFTRVDKLAGNLSLGAYASWLHQLDYQQSDLSAAQVHKARQFAKVLSKNYSPNRFSGRDDKYNNIEGLRHGGFAAEMRHLLTEFGSGWDPVRNLALQTKLGTGIVGAIKRLFSRGQTKEKIYQEFIKSPAFMRALAEGKEIKTLGQGAFGTAKLFEGTINGKSFKYVEKIPTAKVRKEEVISEAHAMFKLSDLNVPTPYAVTQNRRLFMEYVEGSSIDDIHLSGKGLSSGQINELELYLNKMHSRGVAHTDLMQDVMHIQPNQIIKDTMGFRGEYFPRNMLVTPQGHVAILDMGLAKPASMPAEASLASGTLGDWMEANIGKRAATAADFDNLLVDSLRKHGGKLSSRNAQYLELGSSPDFFASPATIVDKATTTTQRKKPITDVYAATIVNPTGSTIRDKMKTMSEVQKATAKDMLTPGKGRNHISRGVNASCIPTVR